MELNNTKFYTVFCVGTESLSAVQEKKLTEGGTIKHVLFFDDDNIDECLECLRLTSNENILLVIIGMATNTLVLDEKILSQVHNLHQVKNIYVDEKYCNRHRPQLFPKVRHVSNEAVCLHIQADIHAHAQVTEPFVFNTFDERSASAMNGDFIHFQMLIKSFVRNRFDSEILDNYSTFAKSKNQFMEVCREIHKNEASTLAKIEEFGHTYTSDQALFWYTKDSFLYQLLNKALRTNDTKLILIFRFFIIDLHKQLADKLGKPFTEENESDESPVYYVYRGQLMTKHELNSLRKSLGNIIAMKSFLSTTLDRRMALFYLGHSDDPSQSSLIQALIEINLGDDNSCMNLEQPFANITEYSNFGEEEKEVLFMVGSYFRVDDVRRGEKGMWHVRLAALRPFDDPLRSKWGALYQHMKINSIHPMLFSLSDIGKILFQSGKFDQAQTHYEQLLEYLRKMVYVPEKRKDEKKREMPSRSRNKSEGLMGFIADVCSDSDECESFEYKRNEGILMCYYALARITNEKGLFDHSTIFYEEVLKRAPPSFTMHEKPGNSVSHVLRALCLLGLGSTYELNGKLKRAFESYTKALHMFEQAHDGYLDDDFVDGSSFTRVQKAYCLVGLGNLCLIDQEYQRADAFYQEALSFFDKYLPVGHPDQSRARQKIANIIQLYRCKPAMALEDYEDCLENYLRALPSDHVDIARVYTDMARAYEQSPSELEKALEYAKKAIDIFEKSLPKEHTDNVTISMIIKRIQRKLSIKD